MADSDTAAVFYQGWFLAPGNDRQSWTPGALERIKQIRAQSSLIIGNEALKEEERPNNMALSVQCRY